MASDGSARSEKSGRPFLCAPNPALALGARGTDRALRSPPNPFSSSGVYTRPSGVQMQKPNLYWINQKREFSGSGYYEVPAELSSGMAGSRTLGRAGANSHWISWIMCLSPHQSQ